MHETDSHKYFMNPDWGLKQRGTELCLEGFAQGQGGGFGRDDTQGSKHGVTWSGT